jgi:hypothetical protein
MCIKTEVICCYITEFGYIKPMKMYVSDSNTLTTYRSDNDTEKFMESIFLKLKCENSTQVRSARADTLRRLLVQTVQH